MESRRRPFIRKKLSNAINNSFSDKHAYDSVFAGGVLTFGAPAFSSRTDDYSEIFGAYGASSIPILDVSALDEAKVSADARSSKLDYSKIFGCFGDCDLGVSYEEMFAKPKGAKKLSVGARTPAETVSYCEGSDQINHFREEAFQKESLNHSVEGVKQFNISYHKTSPRSNDGKHGTTRISPLRVVPGFTCFVDENPPLQKTEGDKSGPPPKVDVTSPPKVYANATKKQTSDRTGKFENQSSGNKFYSLDKSFSANEPKKHSSKMSSPSSVPANLISNKSIPKRSMDSNSKIPQSNAFKAGPGYCSPSFSDEELDVNSAAAASAAALRKALETAQAIIRIAKKIMERKKDRTQRFSKPSSKDGLGINDRREDKVSVDDTRIREKNAMEMSERNDIVFQVFSKSERDKARTRRSGKVAPDLKETKEISIVKEVVGERHGNQWESAEDFGALRQSFGMENIGECRNVDFPCDHVVSRKNIIEFIDKHECGMKYMEAEKEILERPDWCGKKVDAEARKLEDLVIELNILKDTRDLEHHVDRLDSSQEVQEQEENEKARVTQVDEETKGKQEASNAHGNSGKELEEFLEPNENGEFQFLGEKANNNEGLNEAQECMKTEKKLEDTFGEEQNEQLFEEFFDVKENEEIESQGVKTKNEEGHAEALECMENEKKLEDIFGEREGEKLEEFLDLKENEEFESQGVKVNNNEGLVDVQECMENARKVDNIFGEEQNEKLLEEFLDLKENDEFDSKGVKTDNKEGHAEALECMENERELEDIFGERENETEEFLDFKEIEEFEAQGVKVNNNEGLVEAQECMENDRKLEDILGEEQNEKLLEEFLDLNENAEVDFKGLKANNSEKGLDEAQECMENERKLEDHFVMAQNEVVDFYEKESGNGLRKICELNEVDEGLEAPVLWTGYEEVFEVESIEKQHHDAHDGDNNEKNLDKISNKRFSDTCDGEESWEKQEDNSDFAKNENILVDECEEADNVQTETESNETLKVNQEAVEVMMNLDATINACKWEAGESMIPSEEVHKRKQNDHDMYFEENERISDATQYSWEFTLDEYGMEAAEMRHEVGEKESCNSGGLVGDAAEHVEMGKKTSDGFEALFFNHNPANIVVTDTSLGVKQSDQNENDSELSSTMGSGIKVSVCDSSVEAEREADENVAFDLEEVNGNFDTTHVRRVRKQWFETGKKMESFQPCSLLEGEEKTIRIDGEVKSNQIVDEVVNRNIETATAHERKVRKQWFDTMKKMEPSQQPTRYKGEEKTIRIDEEIKTKQFTEKNVDNLDKILAVEEKVKKNYLRKIDEAYKREKEREKDRMAVERAIREARERAFAEARERAERAAVERATAEYRKRVMAEAREKLEKASAATKSSSDKASREAKFREERAAVERATVEARERALEKALSHIPSRESGTRHSFYSSETQKLNESIGESAERHKARLERNQRTMERAEKALTEKNRRDILAQKEQAERNTYAETMDAEVKRWSTGKEGNLRALLSTLQYILGTNSGWQPVPLTEIVTTTAVKKAYRKATLHVHPDKLQQRGATIQQKYICEKVFDLLKAAWNNFNSEERC